MAQRKIQTMGAGPRAQVRVYYDSDEREYQARMYRGTTEQHLTAWKHRDAETYYTTDKDDAIATGLDMARREVEGGGTLRGKLSLRDMFAK